MTIVVHYSWYNRNKSVNSLLSILFNWWVDFLFGSYFSAFKTPNFIPERSVMKASIKRDNLILYLFFRDILVRRGWLSTRQDMALHDTKNKDISCFFYVFFHATNFPCNPPKIPCIFPCNAFPSNIGNCYI